MWLWGEAQRTQKPVLLSQSSPHKWNIPQIRREGHTPGWLLSAFGRFTFSPSPTGFKKIFRDWVGEALGPPAVNRPSTVGSTNPGAVVKSQPLQFSTRPGPSGPKEIAECHSNFARRKFCKIQQVRVPRNGVRGKATMSTECSSEPSPVAFWLLCRHGQSNSPPAGGEISSADNEPNPNPAPSSVTASPCHLSLSPLSLRDISP